MRSLSQLGGVFLAVVLAAVSGCASAPNAIGESTSSFDGSTEYRLNPGFIYRNASTFSSGDVQLGLLWRTGMGDEVMVEAVVAQQIVNIASDGLLFNIDGDIIELHSDQALTDFETSRHSGMTFKSSSRWFTTDLQTIERMLGAESAKVKLVTGDGFLEGDFKADKPSAAIRGFKEFVAKVRAVKGEVATGS